MQHQARILTQQTRGIDPQRQIAAEVRVAGHRRFGVAIDPGTLHRLASFYSAALAIRSGNAAA